MCYRADAILCHGEHLYAAVGKFRNEFRRGANRWIDLEKDNIGVSRLLCQLESFDRCEPGSKALCVHMIFCKSLDMVCEGVVGCGRQNPRLPHSAPQKLTLSVGMLYRRAIANQSGTNGSAESF